MTPLDAHNYPDSPFSMPLRRVQVLPSDDSSLAGLVAPASLESQILAYKEVAIQTQTSRESKCLKCFKILFCCVGACESKIE